DCDGTADDDFQTTPTSCGVGVCGASGTLTCQAGSEVDTCTPGASTGPDTVCDGQDSDCDGQTDEGFTPSATSCGQGVCAAAGTSTCVDGQPGDTCTPGSSTGPDTVCDGLDADCDGAVDEGFVSTGTTCVVGGCSATGALVCQTGSVVDTCLSAPLCVSEVACADGLDNDEDATTDCADSDCAGDPACAEICDDAADNDFDGFTDCADPDCAAEPICNPEVACGDGLDNDLDGDVDCADGDCAADPACLEVCDDATDNDLDGFIDCSDPDCDGLVPCIPEVCGNSLDDDGDGMFDCADLDCGTQSPCDDVAPDASSVAPPLDPTIMTGFAKSIEFLFSGADPIQRGVAPGAIEPKRVSLVSGLVGNADLIPMGGVKVSVLHHPELGYTRTQADGRFHLAINAGGRLTLVIEKSGYLSSHRAVQLEWNRRQTLEPVVLVAPSADKTRIQFGATGAMQVARGEVETDADGTRQATVLFPDGIEASATLHDGTEIPLGGVGSLDVRLTEYTVGGAGAAAMPAALPANSAYTYAFAATADGAESIRFSQPVPVYLENFVGFPVGIGMPLAHYDEDRGQWIPHPNGVVLGVVAITGGLADLDLDGDGVAEDDTALSALAITDQERQTLATLYAPGESLWRLQLPHFSDWDANMGLFPPEEATQPNASVYPRDGENMSEWRDGEGEPAECKEGSQVYCRGGTLGERVPIAGSPYALHYNSERVVGGTDQVRVTLDPKGNQDPVKRVILRIEPQLGTSTTMRWDSGQMPNEVVWQPDEVDLFGRKVTGRLPVDVTLSFVYDCSYQQTDGFGYNGGGIPIGIAPGGGRGGGGASFMAQVPLPPPCEITLSQEMSSYVAELDERSVAGGWSVTPYHRYDVDDGLLVRGDGSSLPLKSAWSTVREIADLDTHEVNPSGPQRSFVQPDGQIVSVSGDVIRALLPDGSEVTPPLATYSTLPCQLMADVVGQPAQGIRLCDDNASGGVERIEPGQDGQILVQAGQSIFRIDRDGIIRDVAGSSIGCGPNTIASPFPLATETCLTSISAFAEG
ncbi:MAG: carboxypeptidase-like regulatory domain-containing protein, partial [Myxococcales bacterium]|nr:carboxypeptidase-like regulatory domain-containing protein [Myxococcales bacterium]